MITIKDIARELHYSISTVSRALQDHPDISAETKRVIVEYAREHHYRPNQLASSLRTQRNTTLGVLLPDITNYFFSTILAGVEKVANEAGYNVLITRTKEDPERERQCLHTLMNSRVAGIIACPTKYTTDFSVYSEVLNYGIPMVVVDRRSPLPCDQVISDDYHGAFQATEYLIQTGCRRLIMCSSLASTFVSAERERGFLEALKAYGVPSGDAVIYRTDSRDELIRSTSDLLSSPMRPDAVFCVNDHTADTVTYIAKMLHIGIPDELAICGFSNDTVTRHTDPMQTTVEQYGHRIGRFAADRLIKRLDAAEASAPVETIVLPTHLIVRETTR